MDPIEDVSPVRTSEQLDWSRLSEYLRGRLPGLDDSRDAIRIVQFPDGHSNLTYLLRVGGLELVLRRPPFGDLPRGAHDVARECRWLSALHPIFPLAPRPYLLCDDVSIIGAPFYLMERRHGVIVRREEPPVIAEGAERTERADRAARRKTAGEAIVGALAGLHTIDVTSGDLSRLGKPAGFVERQVRGWTERWHRAQTSPLAAMDALAAWLRDHLPPDSTLPAVVHGDFKLDNIMFDEGDAGRVVAVLDWEMSALGDPLIDVGILLAYWAPTGPSCLPEGSVVTDRAGWPTREEILELYARSSGRDVSGIRFYEVFALFKVAVVVQQIYSRYVGGQTNDPRFARFDERVTFLASRAARTANT